MVMISYLVEDYLEMRATPPPWPSPKEIVAVGDLHVLVYVRTDH
jgi:hypothetical protein